MIDLIKEYTRFPTVEHFERFVYAVAYSKRIPSHVKFKKSDILIWRDHRARSLQIRLDRPIHLSILHKFLKENEATKLFRPTAYHVLRHDEVNNEGHLLFTVESRIVSVKLGKDERLKRACEILKHYLHYTTFTQSLENTEQQGNRTKWKDCLESIQGYY